jgi:AraC-like DNA-binding protein
VLQTQLLREMHYWLLSGRHGAAICRLGWPDGWAQRIGRAVAVLRAEFASPISVERLARAAGMSASAFYQHLKAATSLLPLQFQKQLRLIETRRMMLAGGRSACRFKRPVSPRSGPSRGMSG